MSRHEVFRRLSDASLELILANTVGGTAVIIDPQGLALTAAHGLLGHPEKIEVVTMQGERMPVEVLAIDLRHDLALLELPPREDGYPHIPSPKIRRSPATTFSSSARPSSADP